jgi:hypothetical protein
LQLNRARSGARGPRILAVTILLAAANQILRVNAMC